MATLVLEGLTKLYRGGRGIRDVSLEVAPGEVCGFIGPNGAGKSTTIRTLLGLLTKTSGRVRLFGDERDGSDPTVRARIGYLPSEPRLYEGMTTGALLAYAGSFFARDTSARRRALAESLELDLTRTTDDLSLGNKKKAALVMALQHEPELLVLDEPTSGLDPLVQQRLFEVIEDEQRRGTTVFFSSHVLTEVERLCERVVILRDGRVTDAAPVDAIRGRGEKRVRARLSSTKRLDATRALAGVTALTVTRDVAELSYRGPVAALLGALAADEIVDVTIGEPSLEQIVLSQYADSASSSVRS